MQKISFWRRTNLIVRSFIFSSTSVVTVFFYAPICLALFPFLSVRNRCHIVSLWVRMAVWILKAVCGIKYEIEGRENIYKIKNGIVLSKHQSMWETLLLPLIFNYPCIILKRELLQVPFSGWVLSGVGFIPINREEKTVAREKILAHGQEQLKKGRWILIFPEGTRIPPGKVGDYKLGGARLAVQTGYPVVPVAHNAGHCWPRRKFIKWPGTVQVVIGDPIETTNKTAEQVMDEVKTWIETTMVRIEKKRASALAASAGPIHVSEVHD